MSKSKTKVRIQGISIEYDGDDPEAFRKAVDAAFDVAFAPLRALTGPQDEKASDASDQTEDPDASFPQKP
jgi:hypothetical protein